MATEENQSQKEESKIQAIISDKVPEEFQPRLEKIKEQSEFLSRQSEKGIINEKSHASVTVRDNGQINITANEYSQIRIGSDGKITSSSMENSIKANRIHIESDDIVVNNHKLNPHLYELTDYRQTQDNTSSVVGNFCISGTVLVKCWETNLKRYVLIRRPARMPMFSPILNVPEIPNALKIDDPIARAEDLQVIMKSSNAISGENK